MLKQTISNMVAVIINARLVDCEMLLDSTKYLSKANKNLATRRVNTNITSMMLARFMIFNVLMVFSS